MGCFSTCFRKSKRRRSRRSKKLTPCFNQLLQVDEGLQPTDVKEQQNAQILINFGPDSIDEQKEKQNLSGRKKVTFDLNVRVYEELPAGDENDGDLLAERSYEKQEMQEDMKPSKEKDKNCASDSSSSSSLVSFPSKAYRYQDCRDSDDEFDDLVSDDDSDHDYMGDDEDEEAENELNSVVQEESESTDEMAISGFMLATNPTQMKDAKETGLNEEESESTDESLISVATNPTQEKDENTTDLNEDVFDSVLQPVENLRQWKAVKARSKLEPQIKAKENKISGQECEIPFSEEPVLIKPTLKSDDANLAKSKNSSSQEIRVDTSLSSWLAGPEVVTPTKSKTSSVSVGNSPFSERTCSPKDFEDRPILGALTVEEIRQFSATSTPRRSPSRSPDDMPIIGSVGSYWSPTDHNSRTRARSKYSEGRKVSSNSSRIPFEKRLEKAASLQKGTVRP